VLPNRGETTGGLLVEIVGLGFAEGMTVYFGMTQANPAETVFLTESRMQTITPAGDPGVVDVAVVESETSFGVLTAGFEYYEKVTLISVTPQSGPTTGGTQVLVEGTGFVEGTRIQFGSTPAIDATLIDRTQAFVESPALARGRYAVTVANNNGRATLADAFRTFEPVRVTGVVPFAGPLAGGTPVVVHGQGLVDPSSVRFGAQTLPAPVSNAGETELATVSVAALPSVEGAVDVTADNANGTHTLARGFVYYDDTNSTPRVISASPATGLIEGGTEIQIVGVGLDQGVTVTVDGVPAQCTVHDGFSMTCITPPAAQEGDVPLLISGPGIDETLVFRYIDLRLIAAVPNSGAVAGGTFVELYGNGFGPDTEVFFDNLPARDITVVSWTKVTLRTPAHAAGPVRVRVETQNVSLEEPSFFTYFDPLLTSSGWTGGGDINGSVNITVVDGSTGDPVAGAYTLLGLSDTPAYAGYTNGAGQITFSGPDVLGAQTATAAKGNHINFSWVQVNARDLIMVLIPFTPISFGPPGPGAAPPVIKGEVTRVKDEYNFGDDWVVLTTTYQSFSIPLPDPGPNSVIINKGPYELWARTGDMVVLALAGFPNGPGGTYATHAMGFYPFMHTEAGSGDPCNSDGDCPSGETCHIWGQNQITGERIKACTQVYEGIDILVDTPLRQQMRVELDDPPILFPPDTTSAFIWYDFGYMGLHPMHNIELPATDVFFAQMPRQLPASVRGSAVFNIYAGVYCNYVPPPPDPAQLTFPLSEIILWDNTDTTRTIEGSPMLGIPLGDYTGCYYPYFGTVTAPMSFDFVPSKTVEPSIYFHVLYKSQCTTPAWIAIAGGDNVTFDLPKLPAPVAGLDIQEGDLGCWLNQAQYTPGAQFNQLEISALSSWRSYSGAVQIFYRF
ncbi:MAG: IPT/TIG domain-containing protein, partial [Deltaproteobacteria bacterium]|nr:IPT/TIG domain-containing protein [Deltaproteobacteria bacterium]